MPGTDSPIDAPRMANGDGTYNLTGTAPTDDACSLEGVSTAIPGTLNPATMTPAAVSLATQTDVATPMGARQITSLHKDGWLDYDNPHVGTPES